ncbi:hypothetical protein ACFX2I_018527 [Malus domestica]
MKYSTAEARFDLKKKLEIFADGKELDVVVETEDLDAAAGATGRDARVFLLVNFDGAMMNIRSSPRFSIYDNGEGDEWEVWR